MYNATFLCEVLYFLFNMINYLELQNFYFSKLIIPVQPVKNYQIIGKYYSPLCFV